ncbi:hypothetical protein EYF80_014452 [Liparis tanakae]|uniref:Uncharacterized protein n=1 Tax=Liparis tanakae TaxID=230148 RepID=A0A4Z2ID25_9TELE|nr:hypothetical protein EYF80_014452 [Liparis tanakae]
MDLAVIVETAVLACPASAVKTTSSSHSSEDCDCATVFTREQAVHRCHWFYLKSTERSRMGY